MANGRHDPVLMFQCLDSEPDTCQQTAIYEQIADCVNEYKVPEESIVEYRQDHSFVCGIFQCIYYISCPAHHYRGQYYACDAAQGKQCQECLYSLSFLE